MMDNRLGAAPLPQGFANLSLAQWRWLPTPSTQHREAVEEIGLKFRGTAFGPIEQVHGDVTRGSAIMRPPPRPG